MICGACNHPGTHAQTLPVGAGFKPRCADCPKCQQEQKAEKDTPRN
jgi:hypothetical protein